MMLKSSMTAYPGNYPGFSAYGVRLKTRNNMHTRGERIQEYGVRISSFYLFQLNNSTFMKRWDCHVAPLLAMTAVCMVFPYSHGAAKQHGGLSSSILIIIEKQHP